MNDFTPITKPGDTTKRLTLAQRAGIAAAVMSGRTQDSVAEQYGLARPTVSRIMSEIRQDLPDAWKSRLTDQLPAKAVDALDRSVSDLQDVHKAAATGMGILKGLGILAGEQQTTVINVLNQVNQSLPDDLQFELGSTGDAIEVLDTPPTPTDTESET